MEIYGTYPYVDRGEILSAVDWFRVRRGIKPRELKNFVIELLPEEGYQSDDGTFGSEARTVEGVYQNSRVWLFCGSLEKEQFPRLAFLVVLFHELDHWAWDRKEGRSFEFDLPYERRPHEERAYVNQWEDCGAFLGVHFEMLR